MSQQRHFSVSEAVDEGSSLQKDSVRQLRTAGSVSNLIPPKTLTLLNEDSETIGDYVYRKIDEIGSGYSSRVYKCRSLKREGLFALKVIDIKKYTNSSLQMLQNQISILKKIKHPNILELEDVYKHPSHCYIVTEYCPEGDLLEYLTKNGKLCEKEAVAITAEVIEAVKYLLQQGIIHRDIKPANIFKSHKTWKLGDFGFAILSQGEIKTRQNVGTPLYMPLQSLQRNIYSPQSDIFAVGVICYEMMVGITPWQSRSQKELMRKMSTMPFGISEKYKVTSPIRYLLSKMCQPNRDDRMTKEEFMELNINNFVSLISFNQQLKATDYKRKARIFSVGKFEKESALKSETVNPLLQTERVTSKGKIEQQYGQNGHRKVSRNELKHPQGHPKVQMRSKSRKKVLDVKVYGNRAKSRDKSAEKVFEMKVVHRNYEILVNQLNYCRFMYYLIENGSHIMLPSSSKGKLTLTLFKHLLKLSKQLADNKNNHFNLTQWQAFRKCSKYVTTHRTLKDYCEKYEKEYLMFLKKAEINVIKDVNQKLPEFTSNQPFSLHFYKKILTYLGPFLKECVYNMTSGPHPAIDKKNNETSARMQALKSIYKYYKLVQMSVKDFQNYEHFNRHSNIAVLKNYRESKSKQDDIYFLRQEIKAI